MNDEKDMDWEDVRKLEAARRIELLTKTIVEKHKREIKDKLGNKKVHRQ